MGSGFDPCHAGFSVAVLSLVATVVVLVGILPCATIGAELLPVPTGAELAKAEKTVRDVFADELKAADTAKQREALARKMIDTAAGSRPAAKYALLVKARELAIAAGDSAVGVRTVAALVDSFQPSGVSAQQEQRGAASWASAGHRLWNDATDKRPPEKLRGRLEAAECYLRCLDGLEGFQRAAVEKRLRGLGWRASPIDFTFDDSTEGWTAAKDIASLRSENGCLTGQITGNDPHVVRTGLELDASRCPIIRIGLSISPAKDGKFFWVTKSVPKWGRGKSVRIPIQANPQAREYRLHLGKHALWAGQTITGIRIDPGDEQYGAEPPTAFSIDYVRGANR